METTSKQPVSFHGDIVNPLLTDMYQLTMAYSYFMNGRHEKTAAFEVFFRKCPFKGQYTIFAGLQEVLLFVQNYKITNEQIQYIKTLLPENANPEFFVWLSKLNCSKLTIKSLKEGDLCFPKEPLMIVSGPLALVQMIETPILNLLAYPCLIATNASRMRRQGGMDKKYMEFGLRRAQGPDGGLTASIYSFIGGFQYTSNVLAGYLKGIPVVGTMSHSFVTSYKGLDEVEEIVYNDVKIKERSLEYRRQLNFTHTNNAELAAFISYAKSFPNNFLCLIDSYSSLQSGVLNFICVAFALQDAGFNYFGVRLDSGDLALLSIDCKKIWGEAGQKLNKDTSKFFVCASNDINEDSLLEFKKKNHQIDMFGIGTNLVTCQKQPALGLVYKLVDFDNEPKFKLSEEQEKQTLPGKKQLYRIWDKSNSYSIADVIALENEKISIGEVVKLVNLNKAQNRYSIKVERVETLLHTVWENGKFTQKLQDIKEIREFCCNQHHVIDSSILQNQDPKSYNVLATEGYYSFYQKMLDSTYIYKNKIEY